MKMRYLVLSCLHLLALCTIVQTAEADQSEVARDHRPVALVIGNANYDVAPLRNALNDAEDVSTKLAGLGYTVLHGNDLNKRQMIEKLQQLGHSIAASRNTAALFYYAGHAVQIDRQNYLIPTNEEIYDLPTLLSNSLDIGEVLDSMEDAGAQVKVLVLDACRNNPFLEQDSYTTNGRSLRISRGLKMIKKGLAPMKGPSGTYIAYATDPGRVASDGDDRNGLYTKYFLKYVELPAVPAEMMFKLVRAAVIEETDGAQIPWENSSLTDDFYFNNPVAIILETARVNFRDERYGDAYRYAKEAYSRAVSAQARQESKDLIDKIRAALGYAN